MTAGELLSRASGRELQAWQAFLDVKAERDKEARRHKDFLGAHDDDVITY